MGEGLAIPHAKLDELDRVVDEIVEAGTSTRRRRLDGLDDRRVDIILGGSLLLAEIFRTFDIDEDQLASGEYPRTKDLYYMAAVDLMLLEAVDPVEYRKLLSEEGDKARPAAGQPVSTTIRGLASPAQAADPTTIEATISKVRAVYGNTFRIFC